jgi:hypothetical protein
MPPTAVRVLAGLLCAVALGACGQAARPAPPVHLTIQAPADGTQIYRASITLSGTVSPARTTVLVLGRPVAVQLGRFSAQVPLEPGENIIDVLAGAPHTAGVADAIRVERLLLVTIPQLGSDSPSRATARLRALGLNVKLQPSDNPLDFLIPFSRTVCSQSPPAGRRVTRGTTVTLQLGKLC